MGRREIETVAELDTLDGAEILEGYQDGLENFPCGENRSRSYWHGWRNGQVDGGYMKADEPQRRLARDYITKGQADG